MKLLWPAAIGAIIGSSHVAAQSDETCIAYMEADAAYEAVSQEHKDEEAAWLDSLPATNRDSMQYFSYILGPTPIVRQELEAAAEARELAYRDAYRGPTSKVPVVMEKLRRLDRIRCRKRFRG